MLFVNKVVLIGLCLIGSAFACETEDIFVGNMHFKLTGKEDGKKLLSTHDAFIDSLNPINRKARAINLSGHSDKEYLEYLGKQAICWTKLERKELKLALTMQQKRIAELGIEHHYHRPISLVKTNGKDELGAPHARGGNIFIPKGKLSYYMLSHELFHVLTAQNPELKDDLYSIINFEPIENTNIPEKITENILVNPDAIASNHAIKVIYNREEITVVPIIVFTKYTLNHFEEIFSNDIYSIDSVIEFKLFNIDTGETVYPGDTNYNRRVGFNTSYIYHPEEILAENYTYLLMDNYAFKNNPEIVENLKEFLSK